jgi:hypothetical protein
MERDGYGSIHTGRAFLPWTIDRRNDTPFWRGRYYEGVEWDCVAKYGSLHGLVDTWEADYVYRIRDRRGRVIWMGRGRPPRSLIEKEGT